MTFRDKGGLERALESRDCLRIHGKKIKIEPFLSGNGLKAKEEHDSQTKIIVFDVRSWMKEGYLFKAFGCFGHIDDVVIKDKGKRSRHAIVGFVSPASASRAARQRSHLYQGVNFGVTIYNPNIPKFKSQRNNLKKDENVVKNPKGGVSISGKEPSKRMLPDNDVFRKKSVPYVEVFEKERRRGPMGELALSKEKVMECFTLFIYDENSLGFKVVSKRRRARKLKRLMKRLRAMMERRDFSLPKRRE